MASWGKLFIMSPSELKRIYIASAFVFLRVTDDRKGDRAQPENETEGLRTRVERSTVPSRSPQQAV
jgi:hypothetical protein